jgi:hypothetical protein
MENPDIWLGAKEGKEVANALKDVESTVKALENVSTFDQQDAKAEVIVGKQKDRWGRSQVWRERIENAGDILREISSRGNRPDVKYIEEKIDKIKNWLLKENGFDSLPKNIKTLKDFEESNVKFSSAVDSWEYLNKFHNDVLQETIDAYKSIVVKTQEEQDIKDFILTLLQGDKSSIYSKLLDIGDIAFKLKKQGELKSTPLNVSEAYHKAKKDGTNPELVKAVEELLGGKEVGGPKKAEAEYKGIFNPSKTGISGLDDLLQDDGYNFFYKGVQAVVEFMSPDEYLKRVRKGFKEAKDVNITEEKKDAIKQAIKEGKKINMPFLSTKDGKFSQEGRNRASVAKEMGEETIPVLIESNVTFDDKTKRAQELIINAGKEGATDKESVLAKLKEQGLHRDAVRFVDDNFDVKAVEELLGGKEVEQPQAPSGPYVPEVLPAANEQQKAGEAEVELLKKGDKITTTNPLLLLKGIEGKKLPDGRPFTAHDGVKGTFSAIKEKIARRYEGEKGVLVFEIPAGVTVEAVQVMSTPESKGVAGSIVRKMEVDAINASDAQVVKLITTDSRGSETQYIIKDPALRKLGYRPSEKAAERPSAMPGNTNADIAKRIRNKKQKGALSAIDFGISVTIYNGALDFMASQVDKGTKLGNAIANTIKWIDEKMAGAKWNKGAFGKYMNDTYSVTLPNGREVEVVRDDSKETAEVINGWYSELEQKILDSKEEKLPAATWMKRLKSKEDEDVWTGVRGFLESKKPSEQVSKKELRDWMKDNRVEIVEVVRQEEGGLNKEWTPQRELVFKTDAKPATGRTWTNNGWKVVENTTSDYSIFYPDGNQLEGSWGSREGAFDRVRMKTPTGTTEFSKYQLEGDKENYKEIVVVLPRTGLMSKVGDYAVPPAHKYGEDLADNRRLVHLRMNTRTDANGNKVLFLEEVQSDWGQKGKKRGFGGLTEQEVSRLKELGYEYKDGKVGMMFGDDFIPKNYNDLVGEAAKIARKAQVALPSAPFVTDTNSWTKLGLKVALREAVKQGADKIAWTTGEQQGDRYDLSKQVDGIEYTRFKKEESTKGERFGEDFYSISMLKDNNMGLDLETGTPLLDEIQKLNDIRESKLDEYVGKELANKIIQSKDRKKTITGVDLKTGGKGMKGFYGSPSEGNLGIVGNVAKSLFKQEPGTVEIDVDVNQRYKVVDENGNTKFNEPSKEAAEARISDDFNKNKGYKIVPIKGKQSTQNSIDITPEMRESVEKGLPLFGTKLSEKQDPVVAFLRSLRGDPNIIGLNAGLWKAFLGAIEKAWNASKSAAQALQAGINFLKEKKENLKEWEQYINQVRERLQNLEKEEAANKEAPEAPPVTPPKEKKEEKKEEGKKPVRELPEAPEGQVVRAILGRSFQATTAQKVADAIVNNGMFRTPGSIEEAFEQGRKFVDDLGFEGAYELFQDLSTVFGEGIVLNELTRLGIFSALTEDLQKEMFDVNSSEQKIKEAADRMAEVQAKASTLVSGAGQLLRMIQAIYEKNTVPYQYERRVKEWKALFPDSPITEETEKKLRDAEAKYNEIYKKFLELTEKQKEWEESQAVSGIKEGIESEQKKERKAPTSVLKQLAQRVRKLGLSRPGFFSAATPASLAWDAAVEVVAVTLEAGGSIEIAIKKGVQAIINSKWYKGLSDKDKKKAEASFVSHHADLMDEGVGMAELVKGNVVVPHALIRYYVAEGMTDINEIADAILESLSEKYPDLTQREVKDAITGYSKKVKKKTPDQIKDSINMLKREGRLQSQLEDLKEGIKKEKDPKQKSVLSQLAKNLMKEIDKIHQEMFGHTPKQMTDEERLAAYKKRTAESIKELKRKIEEGDFTKKQKRPPFDFDKEAEQLEYEKYMLEEDWAEMLREEEKRQATTSTKFGQFLLNAWGVPRSVVVGIDFGVGAIQAGLTTFNSATQTAKAFAGAYKSIMSPTNYQRVDAVLKSHPKYLEAKKAGLKFYSPKDPEVMKGDMASLSSLQRAWNGFGQALSKPLGLALGKAKEKQFYDFWRRTNPLAALERSQAAFVNTLNFGLYLRGAEIAAQRGYTSMKPDNEKVFKQIADVTNTLSRKASLGGLENNKKFMTAMNAIWFSAQNWVSIIKIASPYTFLWFANKRAGATKWNQLSPAQQVYAEIMVKAVGSYLATLILIKLLTGWEDDDMDDEERKKKGATTINLTDPRRSDYLKVRGPVETIDPFAGLSQEVILTYRIAQDMLGNRGFVSTKTGVESYLGEGTTPSAFGLIGRQAEGKLSPTTRFLYRYKMSRPVKGQPSYIRKMYLTGEEINMKEEAQDLFTNLTYETIKDVYTDYNVLPASFNSLLAIYGYGFTREEQIEEKAISKQIRETLGESKKGQVYERAFKDYAKDGDVELAKKVFEKAVGGEEKVKKSIEMLKEMGSDNIQNKYKIDINEKYDYDEFFNILKTGMPISTSGMGAAQAARIAKINALTTEQLDRLKSDYAVQYDELMSAKNVLKKMDIKNASKKPIDWDAKLGQINWVKKYRKAMGIK